MNVVNVAITGVSPLLMHAFPMMETPGLEKRDPKEQAAAGLYLRPDTNTPYIPGPNIQRGLVASAAFSKGKGRSSLQKIIAAAVFVAEPYCDVSPVDWVVDSRPVVIAATKGRIVRHRPRFDQWGTAFSLEYDAVLLSEKQLRAVVDDLGSRVGLLDFRPEKKGPFGRFIVTSWAAV